jgi:hypothetical protein
MQRNAPNSWDSASRRGDGLSGLMPSQLAAWPCDAGSLLLAGPDTRKGFEKCAGEPTAGIQRPCQSGPPVRTEDIHATPMQKTLCIRPRR